MSVDHDAGADGRPTPNLAARLRRRRVAPVAAVVAVGAIGVLDYATGPLPSMSAFYLVPAAWVTAVAGRRAGYLVAALSGVSGALSDVILQPHYGHRTAAAWNVAIMLVTLVVVVELVDQLRRREIAARDAERQGREFLAFAAHQLRTPLASIRSTVDALVVTDGAEADREQLLGGLARESARAGRLVTSLLRVARLDQHEPLPLRSVDIAELARGEVRRAETTWPLIAWDFADDGPVDAVCNPDALSEAIAALIDNARRHARTRVTLAVRPIGDSVEIAVTDDGPGLPVGQEDAAFHRFVSLDGRGGSGLGLPIVRGIAAAHHGTLAYEGGRFVIRLPRRAQVGPATGRMTRTPEAHHVRAP